MLRLYLDADVDPLAGRLLRERGYDVSMAGEVGLSGATDLEQLAYAAQMGRVLVTHNIRDFVPLYEQWWREQRRHPGILVSRQYRRAEVGTLVWVLARVLDVATDDDLTNRLRYLGEFNALDAAPSQG